jgi:hypothetical protein
MPKGAICPTVKGAVPPITAYAEILSRKFGIDYSDFTEDERSCITRKIKVLHDEGYDGDQATAIAIKHCSPTKAQSKAQIGGNYTWSRNDDGTYNMFDIPVFCCHTRKLGMRLVSGADGEPRVEEVKIDVDEKWLSRAVELNRRRYDQDGYLSPLHVRHHPQKEGEIDQSYPAGFFMLKDIRTMKYGGEELPTLYADFVKIPAAVFEDIRRCRLPYRSVESLPPKFEEIDSIALMATEVPWFRFPLLTPGKEIDRRVYSAETFNDAFRGYARSDGGRWSALFYQAGEEFDEKGKDGKGEAADAEEGGNGGPNGVEGVGKGRTSNFKKMPSSDDPSGYMTDEDVDDEDRADMESEGEGDSTMGKILEVLNVMVKGQEILLRKLGGADAPPSTPPVGAPVQEGAGNAAVPAPMQAHAARMAALEDVVTSMKRDKELGEKVRATLAKLASYNLGSDAEAKLLAAAKAAKDPDSVLKVYEETIITYAAPMPPSGSRSDAVGYVPASGKPVPEEVKEYQSRGPEAVEKALRYAGAYEEAVRSGAINQREISKKDFIRYNVDRDFSKLTG